MSTMSAPPHTLDLPPEEIVRGVLEALRSGRGGTAVHSGNRARAPAGLRVRGRNFIGGSAGDGIAMADLKDKLRIGCSGWGYDDWLGGFYPPKTPKSDYLKLYSSVFNTVEVDSSFYRTPGPAMTKAWYKTAPADFTFTMKMPKRITHEKKLNGVAENLGWFYASAKELKEKAGPLVAQLPPSIKYDVHWSLMQDFVKGFDAKYAHAIEFRHKSWFRDDVYALLKDRNVAMVWTENQYLKSPPDVTADYVD